METNSVDRLFEILKEVQNLRKDSSAIEGWKQIFKIPRENETDDLAIYIYLEFINLIKKTKRDIQAMDINLDLYLRTYHNIEKLFDLSSLYRQQWQWVLSAINNQTLTYLEFCVEAMKEFPSEKVIPTDELLNLKKEIDELLNDVLEMDIEPKLKEIIISLLEKINSAIIEYKIHGIKSFEKFMESSLGKIIVNQNLFNDYENEKEITKVKGVFKKIQGFIETANATAELTQTIIKFLPPFFG